MGIFSIIPTTEFVRTILKIPATAANIPVDAEREFALRFAVRGRIFTYALCSSEADTRIERAFSFLGIILTLLFLLINIKAELFILLFFFSSSSFLSKMLQWLK